MGADILEGEFEDDEELDSDLDVDTKAWFKDPTNEDPSRKIPGADIDLQKEPDEMLGGLGSEEGAREPMLGGLGGRQGTTSAAVGRSRAGTGDKAGAVGKVGAEGEGKEEGKAEGEEEEEDSEEGGDEDGDENEDEDDNGDENEKDIENLQHMLLRLQAVRDMGADLPERERKKLAAKAVREVMKGM